MTENRDSCDMHLVTLEKADSYRLDAGDFYIGYDKRGQLMMRGCLPNGVNFAIPLRPLIDPKINDGHSWQWDGNMDLPTLTPSVNCVEVWHGFITHGRMVSC